MNIFDTGRNYLKNFREIGLVGPCFEKSVQTSRMIAKMSTFPPPEKGRANIQFDKKTKKLEAYSKNSALSVRKSAPDRHF